MALEAPLRVMEIDLAAPLEPLVWRPEENGAHVLVRHGIDLVGRLWLARSADPGGLTAAALETLARQKLSVELTRRLMYRELIASVDLGPPPPPSLTVTVCTRNRPVMLIRCIESIRATCAQHPDLATNVEILVVDNAPPDDATRDVVGRVTWRPLCPGTGPWPGFRTQPGHRGMQDGVHRLHRRRRHRRSPLASRIRRNSTTISDGGMRNRGHRPGLLGYCVSGPFRTRGRIF